MADDDYDYVLNNFRTQPIKDGKAALEEVPFVAAGKDRTVVKITIKTDELFSEDEERTADLLVQPTTATYAAIMKFEGNFLATHGPFRTGLKVEKGKADGPFKDKHSWVPPLDNDPPPEGETAQEPFELKAPVNGRGFLVTGELSGYDKKLDGEIVTGRLVLFIEV